MNLFTWLLAGHLLGDWLLQNDWMAQGKKAALLSLAGLAHYAVYTAAVMSLLWLSGEREQRPLFYLGAGVLIFFSHWLIDATRLVQGWMSFFRQSPVEVVRIMVDQTFHLLVLIVVAVF